MPHTGKELGFHNGK